LHKRRIKTNVVLSPAAAKGAKAEKLAAAAELATELAEETEFY